VNIAEGAETNNATGTPNNATTTITTATKSNRPIVLIILGSEDYSQDAKNLLNWTLNAYE
jgi:D-alanyl-D-alanine carboxypeptidase